MCFHQVFLNRALLFSGDLIFWRRFFPTSLFSGCGCSGDLPRCLRLVDDRRLDRLSGLCDEHGAALKRGRQGVGGGGWDDGGD